MLKNIWMIAKKQLFQSSPSPKTGRYFIKIAMIERGEIVPILTQSENWALYYFNLLHFRA